MKHCFRFSICLVAAVAGIQSFSLQAQTGGASAADKLDSWRRAREEYLQAEGILIKRNVDSTLAEKQIDALEAEKKKLQKEINVLKVKFDNAVRRVAAANALSDKEELEKAEREHKYWQAALETAQLNLAQVDTKLQAAIDTLKQSMVAGAKSDVILPGESIQIFVVEDESFNGLYQVREGGYIVMSRVGRVTIAGKDLVGVEKVIKEALEASQLRQATVMVERTTERYSDDAGHVIYLDGEFKTPGALRIPAGAQLTLVKTILRSGGLTDAADLTRVKLLRLENGNALVEEVNVQAIKDGHGLQSDLSVNPGDIIVVPSLKPVVYVTGNVVKPGQLVLSPEEELTAYSAVLRSGGFARFASLRKVYVLRDHGGGEKTRIPIDIKKMRKGEVSDIVLQGKDIVVVPESFFSF